MKILLIHCYYTVKGGEDAVFEQEGKKLAINNDVRILKFYNKNSIAGGFQFLVSIWNISAAYKIKRNIRDFKPEVVHLHNWHFAIGPLCLRTIKKLNVPLVVTLHNYRLICPSATLLLNGEISIEGLKTLFPLKSIFAKAYRESYILTFWLAFINWFHSKIGTWKKVDKYIVLTEFAKEIFCNSRLEIEDSKIVVKPNFVDTEESTLKFVRSDHFLFVGRLSEEKGVLILLEVFKNSQNKLRIAGDGPLIEKVIKFAENNSNITFLGRLDKSDVVKEIRQCNALIFPSIWFEGMPMTVIEAQSEGTCVIASDIGAMASMIQQDLNGLLFEMGSAFALNKALKYWVEMSTNKKNEIEYNALMNYENLYNPEKNIKDLEAIYKSVLYN
ncbi:MAG: hypothetical protein CL868_01620 [Cytophagaceae bacterium]|nr:hypothetical protein [Cytophagaceae bacterium]|tara:strand:+ start:414 stop:1571 length:1158 start_codon:yes stop_codon:yes gene_type:complete